MTWLVILLVLAGLYAAPFLLERRKPDMDENVRASSTGDFAMLSDGHTHYNWHGPKDGPVLVCIHGLTTSSYVWDKLLPGLTEAGFRVLTYDLYGRGLSDRPKGTQARSFFIRQLRDLLDHLKVEQNITLFGYSMGGSIATIFAAEEPDRIARVALLAPAGLVYTPSRFSEVMRRLPRLGDWLMLTLGAYSLRKQVLLADTDPEFSDRQVAELNWRGYLPAVLSSQRNLLAETLEEEHRNLGKFGLPVLAIWGEADTVIPLVALGKLTEWNRNARQASIPTAGHALGVTHPDEVIEALAELLVAD